jgi:hypothetical protein
MHLDIGQSGCCSRSFLAVATLLLNCSLVANCAAEGGFLGLLAFAFLWHEQLQGSLSVAALTSSVCTLRGIGAI